MFASLRSALICAIGGQRSRRILRALGFRVLPSSAGKPFSLKTKDRIIVIRRRIVGAVAVLCFRTRDLLTLFACLPRIALAPFRGSGCKAHADSVNKAALKP